eukprot:428473_1
MEDLRIERYDGKGSISPNSVPRTQNRLKRRRLKNLKPIRNILPSSPDDSSALSGQQDALLDSAREILPSSPDDSSALSGQQDALLDSAREHTCPILATSR